LWKNQHFDKPPPTQKRTGEKSVKKNWSILFGLAILTASVAVGCQTGNPFNTWGGPPANPYASQPPYQPAGPVGPNPYGSPAMSGNAPSYGAPAYGAPAGYGGQPVGSGPAPASSMGSGSR